MRSCTLVASPLPVAQAKEITTVQIFKKLYDCYQPEGVKKDIADFNQVKDNWYLYILPYLKMIYTDFQPFLLSGTDAWALSPDKATELLSYLEDCSVRQVFCIPPIKQENPENTTEFLKGRFEKLKKVYTGGVELKLAGRYRLDESFGTLLKGGSLLTIREGRELLVDVSPLKESADIWCMLEAIVQAGYTPVVMQPERTVYWRTEDFFRLKEVGCQLMLNGYSLFGYNGDESLNYSRMLLKKEMYAYLCSGMEDTKVMRYSEQMAMGEDAALIHTVQALERNNRLLWSL